MPMTTLFANGTSAILLELVNQLSFSLFSFVFSSSLPATKSSSQFLGLFQLQALAEGPLLVHGVQDLANFMFIKELVLIGLL